MDQICDDYAPVAITRNGHGAMVMMPMETIRILKTFFVVRTRRLIETGAELEDCKGKEKGLGKDISWSAVKNAICAISKSLIIAQQGGPSRNLGAGLDFA